MTTIHAYTNDQRLADGPHKDLRRAGDQRRRESRAARLTATQLSEAARALR